MLNLRIVNNSKTFSFVIINDTDPDIVRGVTSHCMLRSKTKWLADSAIRIAYRSSLRSSSVWEPRYPPLRIFIFYDWIWSKNAFFKSEDLPKDFKVSAKQPKLSDKKNYNGVNDPTAGSPTVTLLRLLLPLSDKVYLTSDIIIYNKVQKVYRITQNR